MGALDQALAWILVRPGTGGQRVGARAPCPAGTPPHRIHGSAVVLLLAAAQGSGEPRLPGGALHALRGLGITRATRFEDAAGEALLAWDRQLHAGERTAELA